jgi:hypothetical protein
MFSKTQKMIANQFSRSKVIDCVGGTFHKALEPLALRETLRFLKLAVKGLNCTCTIHDLGKSI